MSSLLPTPLHNTHTLHPGSPNLVFDRFRPRSLGVGTFFDMDLGIIGSKAKVVPL